MLMKFHCTRIDEHARRRTAARMRWALVTGFTTLMVACSSENTPPRELGDSDDNDDETAETDTDSVDSSKRDASAGKADVDGGRARDAATPRMDATRPPAIKEDAGASDASDAGAPLDPPSDESACTGPLSPEVDPLPDDVALPIVFVHGFAGSAQQYQSQAMRFVANGYPAERIVAYDHDGAGSDFAAYADGVDQLVDSVREQFGVDKVYLVGHSRGTIVSSLAYLSDAERAAKVAKYVSLDGAGCLGVSVPCLAPSTGNLPGHAHVEVSTSAESFEMQYEFLVGEAPEVVDILPDGEPIEISGRAVNFPANTGRAGSTLEIWEIDAETGARVTDSPHATFELDETGDFGPVTVTCGKHYEKVLLTPGNVDHHFYFQPYVRSTSFVRLLSGGADSATAQNTNRTDNHTAVVAMRMREWNTTDVLEVSTVRPNEEQEPINAVVSSVGNANIAIYLHDDAASPGESSLEPLPNLMGSFQASVDVFIPASDPPDGTVILKNLPRGDESKPQILRFPNWASSDHTITAVFNDYAQDAP